MRTNELLGFSQRYARAYSKCYLGPVGSPYFSPYCPFLTLYCLFFEERLPYPFILEWTLAIPFGYSHIYKYKSLLFQHRPLISPDIFKIKKIFKFSLQNDWSYLFSIHKRLCFHGISCTLVKHIDWLLFWNLYYNRID